MLRRCRVLTGNPQKTGPMVSSKARDTVLLKLCDLGILRDNPVVTGDLQGHTQK